MKKLFTPEAINGYCQWVSLAIKSRIKQHRPFCYFIIRICCTFITSFFCCKCAYMNRRVSQKYILKNIESKFYHANIFGLCRPVTDHIWILQYRPELYWNMVYLFFISFIVRYKKSCSLCNSKIHLLFFLQIQRNALWLYFYCFKEIAN